MSEIEDNLVLCASSVQSERVEAYNIITRKLSAQHHAAPWGTNISSENVKKIIQNVKEDLFCIEDNIAFETTGFLGCFLDNERLMNLLSVEEEQDTFDVLIKLLKACEDKKILNRALWSFAQSKFGCDIYSKNICKILNVIKSIMEDEQTSITRYEALQVIKSLLESSPNDMKEKIDVWFIMVFNSFFHESVRVRGIAYSCILICKNMQHNDTLDMLYTQMSPCLKDLKEKHCKTMSLLIEDDCIYILKIWRLIVTILGAHLHPGTALINGLLEVVEKAFKNARPECRVDAFKCWQVLITNFALDAKVINHPKRMKLLLAPFKSNNAKTEEIANAKLTAWWHFIVSLGERCSDHFDTVVVPLFKYCFHTTGAPTTCFERSFTMATVSSPARKYPGLHIKSIEMLSAVFCSGTKSDSQTYSLSIPELRQKLITPAVFLRNYQPLFTCMSDALQILNMNNSKEFALGTMLLTRVAQHVDEVIQADSQKKECAEMVKDLLFTCTALEKANEITNSFLLEFFKIFVIGKLALPSSVMNSRNYNVPVGSKPQELVSGTLNNFFVHKFLQPSLLLHKSKEIYKKLWEELFKKSSPACGKLSFFEFTIEELNNSATLLCTDSVDTFVDLWMQAASHLHEYIKQENTIDQGDGSDYDWRCMYKYFLFPIKNSHDHLVEVENSPNFQKILTMLAKLWTTFTSHCSLTSTAEPNCECDFIAKDMISMLTEKFTAPPDAIAFTLTFMAELLYIIVGQFRFKDLGKKSIKAVQSPLRARKKPHALHNLGGCVDLLCIIMEKGIRIISSSRGVVMAKVAATATIICKRIPKKYSWPFVSALCEVLRKAMSINPSAMYTPNVELLFVEMWTEYTLCLERFIGKNLTADQLARLSPILIAGLTSSHDGLKQKAKELWYNNFSSTKIPIPTNLYDVLKRVGLPPANISDTLTESQDAFYTSTGIISSKLSARVDLSPITPKQKIGKGISSPNVGKATPKSAKKSIFEMNDDDFVKVSSPSVNNRLVSTKQAERMRSRGSDIPALYSDLSQSMSQLPMGFTTQDSFDQSSNENSSRSKELFPPLAKIAKPSKETEDPSLCIDSVPSPLKNDSPSKNYSDEDLNEILKDTSIELEKSLSEGDKGSRPSSRKVSEKTPMERKRKPHTPSKKSIDDVRKSLKGAKFAENAPQKEQKRKSNSSPSMTENVSKGNRQPLKDVNKSPKKPAAKGQSNTETIPDSDEEIPCSQTTENSASKSILSKIGIDSPSGQNRPKRNKRKCIDDGYVYSTPTKRLKPSQTSDGDSVTKAGVKSKTTEASTDTVTPSKSKMPSKSTEFNTLDNSCGDKEVTRSARKKRCKGLEVQKLKHDNFDYEPAMLISPTKVTRSGRRIVAPKKEMPESITTPVQNTDAKKLSPTKSPSPRKSPAKTAISPSSSSNRIVSKAGSKEKSEKTTSEAVNAKFNRKLFDDSPQKKETRLESKLDADVNSLVSKSPSKSHSPTRQSLQRAKKNISPSPSPKKQPKRSISVVSPIEEILVATERDSMSLPALKTQLLDTDLKSMTPPSPKKQKLETAINIRTPSPSPKKLSSDATKTNATLSSPKKQSIDEPKRKSSPFSSPKKSRNNKSLSPIVEESIAAQNGKETPARRSLNNENQNQATDLILQIVNKLDKTETSKEQNRVTTRKRNCSDVEVESPKNNKVTKITKCSPKTDSVSNVNNTVQTNTTEICNNVVKSPQNSLESPSKMDTDEKDNDLEKEAEEVSTKQLIEDENKNMVKESLKGKDDGSPSKYGVRLSFSGLIVKDNSPRKLESSVKNQIKTASVIMSPTKQTGKDDSDASLPFIFVRNFQRKDEPSPSRKTPILVMRQSPSSTEEKAGSPSKKLSPPKRKSDVLPTSEQRESAAKAESEAATKRHESPLGLMRSRLSDTNSTPEIHQMRRQKVHHPSRAAAMLARAQQTMKNKTTESLASPVSRRFSRHSRSLPNGNSPLVGQKSADFPPGSGSPWARFEPSPNASPSSGILKRKRLQDDDVMLTDSDYGTSPCLTKNRRVSFADPVFESIEIPPSPKVLRNMRAQKKLDMTKSLENSCSNTVEEAMPLKEVNKELGKDRVLDTSKPIYPDLANCQKPVTEILSQLALPGMTNGLSDVLKTSSVNTVGDIAQLTESELHMFPVQSPKTERTVECLKKFAVVESCKTEETAVESTTVNGAQFTKSASNAINIGNTEQTIDPVSTPLAASFRSVSDATDEELFEEIHSRLDKSSKLVKKFAENVNASQLEEMFKSLMPYLPYARVIDIYSDFLKNKASS